MAIKQIAFPQYKLTGKCKGDVPKDIAELTFTDSSINERMERDEPTSGETIPMRSPRTRPIRMYCVSVSLAFNKTPPCLKRALYHKEYLPSLSVFFKRTIFQFAQRPYRATSTEVESSSLARSFGETSAKSPLFPALM